MVKPVNGDLAKPRFLQTDFVQACEEPGGVAAFERVLPEAEDGPAAGAEGAGDEAVAGAVGGDL